MHIRSAKNFTFFLILLAGFGLIEARGQDKGIVISNPHGMTSPCPLKINTISYIAPTTERKPIDEVNLVLVNTKTREIMNGLSKDGVVSFDSIADGSYTVTLTKVGYRKSIDIVKTDCGTAFLGVINRTVPMWEGDPAKTVDYSISFVEEDKPKKDLKGSQTFKISPAETDSDSVLNGSARILAVPKFPPAAKAIGANGAVEIEVVIDEDGYVVSAKAIKGHPLLKSAAAEAARASRFRPTLLSGKPVKVAGIIVYNFQ